ncbi:hypothetical protein [Nocardioides lentus]|uniref:hypothetical protein n=1 Tax=Nocardioides lentus TaxID=338077 RepID=UPI0031DE2AE8
MVTFDEVKPEHVLRALKEYDELGGDVFLAKYGFGRATDYLLVHDGRDYDSKAVLGAAQGHAVGRPATHDQFSGGRTGAAKVLEDLGFEVVRGSSRDVADVGPVEAQAAWAAAAREVLIDAARRYHSITTYRELADEVQSRSGVTTSQLMHHWIGDVLLQVARENAEKSEPALMALCVDARGRVGPGYAKAVEATTGAPPSEPDTHAAQERLRCHQFFGAPDLPSNGGRVAHTPQVARARDRVAKAAAPAMRPPQVCPRCHMAIPATGVCDQCG